MSTSFVQVTVPSETRPLRDRELGSNGATMEKVDVVDFDLVLMAVALAGSVNVRNLQKTIDLHHINDFCHSPCHCRSPIVSEIIKS